MRYKVNNNLLYHIIHARKKRVVARSPDANAFRGQNPCTSTHTKPHQRDSINHEYTKYTVVMGIKWEKCPSPQNLLRIKYVIIAFDKPCHNKASPDDDGRHSAGPVATSRIRSLRACTNATDLPTLSHAPPPVLRQRRNRSQKLTQTHAYIPYIHTSRSEMVSTISARTNDRPPRPRLSMTTGILFKHALCYGMPIPPCAQVFCIIICEGLSVRARPSNRISRLTYTNTS